MHNSTNDSARLCYCLNITERLDIIEKPKNIKNKSPQFEQYVQHSKLELHLPSILLI